MLASEGAIRRRHRRNAGPTRQLKLHHGRVTNPDGCLPLAGDRGFKRGRFPLCGDDLGVAFDDDWSVALAINSSRSCSRAIWSTALDSVIGRNRVKGVSGDCPRSVETDISAIANGQASLPNTLDRQRVGRISSGTGAAWKSGIACLRWMSCRGLRGWIVVGTLRCFAI